MFPAPGDSRRPDARLERIARYARMPFGGATGRRCRHSPAVGSTIARWVPPAHAEEDLAEPLPLTSVAGTANPPVGPCPASLSGCSYRSGRRPTPRRRKTVLDPSDCRKYAHDSVPVQTAPGYYAAPALSLPALDRSKPRESAAGSACWSATGRMTPPIGWQYRPALVAPIPVLPGCPARPEEVSRAQPQIPPLRSAGLTDPHRKPAFPPAQATPILR